MFNIKYTFQAIDKFTKEAEKIKAQISEVEKRATGMTMKMASFAKQSRAIGNSMSTKITLPVVAAFTAFGVMADHEIQALALIENALKMTGRASKLTSQQLIENAKSLQKVSRFGDDDILKEVTLGLLRFKNINDKMFIRLHKNIIDVSAATGNSLSETANKLGSSLSMPQTSFRTLRELGISFSDSQKKHLETLLKQNKLYVAQEFILKGIESRFAGAAETAAAVGAGPFKQFVILLGDISEELGMVIFEVINPFLIKFKKVLEMFIQAPPWVKKLVVAIMAITAIIGPLIFVLSSLALAIAVVQIAALGIPIAIGLGIAALVAIFTFLFIKFKTFRTFIIILAKGIKMIFFDPIILIFKGLFFLIEKVIQGFSKVKSILGFGSTAMSNDVNLKKSISANIAPVKNNSVIDVNINAPPQTVKSIKAKSDGKVNTNLGNNLSFSY